MKVSRKFLQIYFISDQNRAFLCRKTFFSLTASPYSPYGARPPPWPLLRYMQRQAFLIIKEWTHNKAQGRIMLPPLRTAIIPGLAFQIPSAPGSRCFDLMMPKQRAPCLSFLQRQHPAATQHHLQHLYLFPGFRVDVDQIPVVLPGAVKFPAKRLGSSRPESVFDRDNAERRGRDR